MVILSGIVSSILQRPLPGEIRFPVIGGNSYEEQLVRNPDTNWIGQRFCKPWPRRPTRPAATCYFQPVRRRHSTNIAYSGFGWKSLWDDQRQLRIGWSSHQRPGLQTHACRRANGPRLLRSERHEWMLSGRAGAGAGRQFLRGYLVASNELRRNFPSVDQ